VLLHRCAGAQHGLSSNRDAGRAFCSNSFRSEEAEPTRSGLLQLENAALRIVIFARRRFEPLAAAALSPSIAPIFFAAAIEAARRGGPPLSRSARGDHFAAAGRMGTSASSPRPLTSPLSPLAIQDLVGEAALASSPNRAERPCEH